MVDAIILAGGLGTRLRSTVPDLPKSLAPIQGIPFLDYLLDQIEQAGVVKKIILAIGYKGEMILERYQKIRRKTALDYSIEKKPLGTGGAIQKALQKTSSSRVFVFNGDSFIFCNLETMFANYQPYLTMAYTFVEETSRYGTLELDATKKIIAFYEKQLGKGAGFINAGIYLFDRKIFHRSLPEAFSFEKELLPSLIQEGMYGYFSKGPLIDIGTQESYFNAQTVQIFREMKEV